jgi:hypothetical protein
MDDAYEFVLKGTVKISPDNAIFFGFEGFVTPDGQFELLCMKDENNLAALVYVDRNVTINGTRTEDGYICIWNVSLKKGWNYYVMSTIRKTATFTLFTIQPSG